MSFAQRLMLAMAAVALATVAPIALIVGPRIEATVVPVAIERERALLDKSLAEFRAFTEGMRADATSLSNALPQAALGTALRDDAPLPIELADQVTRLFKARIDAEPSYLQIRLISARGRGREVARLERPGSGGPTTAVPDERLQDKGDRPYLRETLAMPAGQVYVSPIELNQEYGRVEVPHVPVLRAGIAVRDADGVALAAVVINVDMGPALAALGDNDRDATTYLVSAAGDFLVHPDPGRRFASDLGHGQRFAVEFPELAGNLASAQPWVAERTDADGRRTTLIAAPLALAGGQTVTMVNAVPSLGAATVDAVRRLILAAAAIGVLFALLTASLLARSFSRPIRNLVEAVEGSDDDARLDLPSDVGGEIGVLARALQASRARSSEGIRALRTQEARFRTLFEASPSALLLIDASHRIALVNTRTEGLFGYARQELIGQPLDLLVPVERRAAHREHMAAYAGHPVARDMGANLELHGLRKDGGTVPIAVGLSPLAGPDGRQTLAAVIDVTERKGYEDKLRRSNQELAQFAYVAAHDLREPLRIIASYSELLARRYQESLDERARRYIDYLVTEAKRMQGLITDLLAYSRLESQGQPPSRVVTDVELAAVLHTLQPLIVRVAATLHAGPLPDVLADATQLRMLLQNLLNNALVYHGSEPPRIEISAEQQGRQVRFAVRDNGVGIGAEHAERVFQMFQRLGPKTADAGSGIGLALVKRIVERHGGQVWFESEVGQGTTFYFTLEAAPQDAD